MFASALMKHINGAWAKTNEYRHAGTDLKITRDRDGDQVITINQQYYIDMAHRCEHSCGSST